MIWTDDLEILARQIEVGHSRLLTTTKNHAAGPTRRSNTGTGTQATQVQVRVQARGTGAQGHRASKHVTAIWFFVELKKITAVCSVQCAVCSVQCAVCGQKKNEQKQKKASFDWGGAPVTCRQPEAKG